MRRTDRDPSLSSSRWRRPERRLTLSVALFFLVLGSISALTPAAAQDDGPDEPEAPAEPTSVQDAPIFDVIQVSGFLDDILADFIDDAIDKAERERTGGLILQVNSTRALVSDERVVELAEHIAESEVPVYGWVGPSGANAEREMAQLLGVTEELAVAVGAEYGNVGELVVPEELLSPEFLAAADALESDTVDEDGIIELGLAGRDAPTLGFFALELPGFVSEIDDSGDEPVRVPVSQVRFTKLSIFEGWMHNFASPAMAYLFFLIGLSLLIFEFYTAGIGIAGVVGAGCFILGCYGLAALPVRWWALTLLVVAMFGYAVDVQTGVPRAWSVIATVCLVIGSLFLYDGPSLSWITLLVGIAGIATAMISGMPAMVRTRFGTPTIGREWMVGAMGVAAERIKKEGVVMIEGAPWKARVNRTTPIDEGDIIRVVAIEGLYLEIEPEEGGARDYREMRSSD